MAFVGTSKTFDKKFSFKVFIEGFLSFGFQKMSALEAEVADIKYYEGGALIPNKSAGRLEFKDVTLERGATRLDFDSLIWFSTVANAPANLGFREPFYKRNLTIVQYERDGFPIKGWTLFGAWPKQYTAGDWDNTADENVIEKIVLCYDYFLRAPI
jgi:phage tail-like protein